MSETAPDQLVLEKQSRHMNALLNFVKGEKDWLESLGNWIYTRWPTLTPVFWSPLLKLLTDEMLLGLSEYTDRNIVQAGFRPRWLARYYVAGNPTDEELRPVFDKHEPRYRDFARAIQLECESRWDRSKR